MSNMLSEITNISIENIDELAIYGLIEGYSQFMTVEELLDKDPKKWTGIEYSDWEKVQGKKETRVFSFKNDDEEIVDAIKSVYTYTYKDDTDWEVSGYERFIQYLKPDGSIGVEKKIKSEQAFGKIFRLNRNIKSGVIDDLRQRGKDLEARAADEANPAIAGFFLSVAAATDSLLQHYYHVINDECLDFTWQPWIDAINNEPVNEKDENGDDKLDGDGQPIPNKYYQDLHTPASSDGQVLVKDFILAEIVKA